MKEAQSATTYVAPSLCRPFRALELFGLSPLALLAGTRCLLFATSVFYTSLATIHTASAQTDVEADRANDSEYLVEVPDTLPALLKVIEARYQVAQTLQGEARFNELSTVRMLLGNITEAFPGSNEALSLALGEQVGKVDPAALDEELATLGSAVSPRSQKDSVPVDPVVEGLSECIVGSDLSEGGASIRIRLRVELDEVGNIKGMPDLLDPLSPDAETQKVFQSSLIALDGCPGLKSFDLPTVVEISLTSSAVESATVISSTITVETLTVDVAEPLSISEPVPVAEPTWEYADSAAEKSLGLGRSEIAELQVRLKLLGYDPKGIDGVAGKGMRKAISDWQADRMLPSSGFVDGRQLEKLREETANEFSAWVAQVENSAALDRASKPPKASTKAKGQPAKPSGGRKWYRDERGWYCTSTILGAMCQRNRP